MLCSITPSFMNSTTHPLHAPTHPLYMHFIAHSHTLLSNGQCIFSCPFMLQLVSYRAMINKLQALYSQYTLIVMNSATWAI